MWINNICEKIIYKLIKMKYTSKSNWGGYVQQKTELMQSINSSISDNNIYPAFCEIASKRKDIFKVFRRVDVYCKIVGGGSAKSIERYINYIDIYGNKEYKECVLSRYKIFDKYGMPYKHYGMINNKRIMMSSSTAMHLKVILDLQTIFSQDKLDRIVEIGGGYGGLCSVIDAFYNFCSYQIIDLPQVNMLQEKYLELFNLNNKVKISSCTEFGELNEDVFLISNYAFSELSREMQDEYFDKVLSHSKYGYMICNNISENDANLHGYSLKQLQEKIPGSVLIGANPMPHNIIIWGYDSIPDRYLC